MSTTNRKGKRSENECREYLNKEGYLTYFVTRKSRFGKGDQDIFSMFDGIAFHASKNAPIRFIQVKSGTTHGFLKKLKKWAISHQYGGAVWECWVRKNKTKDKIKWKIYKYHKAKNYEYCI